MWITDQNDQEITKLQVKMSLPLSFLLLRSWDITNYPKTPGLPTISICFAPKRPGQGLSWAQPGLVGQLWPRVPPAVAAEEGVSQDH